MTIKALITGQVNELRRQCKELGRWKLAMGQQGDIRSVVALGIARIAFGQESVLAWHINHSYVSGGLEFLRSTCEHFDVSLIEPSTGVYRDTITHNLRSSFEVLADTNFAWPNRGDALDQVNNARVADLQLLIGNAIAHGFGKGRGVNATLYHNDWLPLSLEDCESIALEWGIETDKALDDEKTFHIDTVRLARLP